MQAVAPRAGPPVRSPCGITAREISSGALLAQRKPTLLLRLSGVLLLRLETRAFRALLFHEPPRTTHPLPFASTLSVVSH